MQALILQTIIYFLVVVTLFNHVVSVPNFEQSKQDTNVPGKLMSSILNNVYFKETCKFENGERKCYCEKGFENNNGRCQRCDCGPDPCYFEFGVGRCSCKEGFKETNWECRECDCGSKGTCDFTYDGKLFSKKCSCQLGFAAKDGKCVECDCGPKRACFFDDGVKKCLCKEGYEENDEECEECDCGPHGICSFEYGEKKCYCKVGFQEMDGKCFECYCGEKGKCNFIYGKKNCECPEFYIEDNGICRGVEEGLDICSNSVFESLCGKGSICYDNKCDCAPGYRVIDSTIKILERNRIQRCEDIDECFENIHNCSSNTVCINTQGDYYCHCKPGYIKVENSFLGMDKEPCIGLCDANPCGNGTCQILEDYLIYCICDDGFFGPFWEDKIEVKYKIESNKPIFIGIVTFFCILIMLLSGTLCYIHFTKKKE